MRRFVPVLTVIALAALFTGCEQTKPKDDVAGKPEAARPAASGDTLAVVGERAITTAMFQTEVDKLPAQHRQWTQTPQGRKYIIDNLVESMLIEDEARKRGVDRKPDVAQKIDNYRRQLLKDGLMEEILKGEVQVADGDAQRYFAEHPAEFKQPEKIKILDMVLAEEAAARDVVGKLNKGGDFAALAREKSVDPYTKERSGDLPEFTKEMRPELYGEAAAARKAGQVIGPVKTAQGFHVMRFVKKIPPEEKAYDQVKDALKARLQAMKRQESYSTFIKGLREAAKVQTNEEFISGPKQPAPPAAPQPGQGGPARPAPAKQAPQPSPPKGK